MEMMVWLVSDRGRIAAWMRGEVSSIAPTPWFAGKVREAGISLADFGRGPGEEAIVLTRNTRSWTDAGERVTHRDRIDYVDTGETRTASIKLSITLTTPRRRNCLSRVERTEPLD